MEYISKQSLLADLNEATPRSYFAFETMIRGYPTEDVAPVIHAHWILHDDNNDIWDCSNCKTHIFINLLYGNKAEYCPKCGARMDEEVDNV